MTRDQLVSSAKALLDLDAKGALVPHGIGGHARTIIEGCLAEIATTRRVTIEECAKIANGWEAGDRRLAKRAKTSASSLHHEIAADMAHDIAASIRTLNKEAA